MSFKGTNGDWSIEVVEDEELGSKQAILSAPSHEALAKIVWEMEDDKSDAQNQELRANAFCMVYSPKLLRVLEDLLDPKLMASNPHEIVNRAKTLIFLAQGRKLTDENK